MKSKCASIVLERYANVICYKPELFTAIHLKRWTDVHVNLFFSGNVIVFGQKAYQRAFEIRQWLERIAQQSVSKCTTAPSSSATCFSDYDEAVRQLVALLPVYFREMSRSYFYSFPLKLIKSWTRQITVEGEGDKLIPRLCNNIA